MNFNTKNIRAFIVLFSLLTVSFWGSAQSGEGFKNFIHETFEINLNNLSSGNNSTPFLRAFGENLIWMDVDVSIDGRVSAQRQSKDGLRKIVNRLDLQRFLTVKWKIISFSDVQVRENTRMASFEVAVELYADNEMIQSGKNYIRTLGKKTEDGYVIDYISIMQIADKLYKGRCFVSMNKENPSKITTETLFPNGTDYEGVTNDFYFIGTDKLRVVKLDEGGTNFYWNTIQGIVSTDKLGEQKIGDASDANTVITVILKNQNINKCTNMIVTNPIN